MLWWLGCKAIQRRSCNICHSGCPCPPAHYKAKPLNREQAACAHEVGICAPISSASTMCPGGRAGLLSSSSSSNCARGNEVRRGTTEKRSRTALRRGLHAASRDTKDSEVCCGALAKSASWPSYWGSALLPATGWACNAPAARRQTKSPLPPLGWSHRGPPTSPAAIEGLFRPHVSCYHAPRLPAPRRPTPPSPTVPPGETRERGRHCRTMTQF